MRVRASGRRFLRVDALTRARDRGRRFAVTTVKKGMYAEDCAATRMYSKVTQLAAVKVEVYTFFRAGLRRGGCFWRALALVAAALCG